MNLGLMAIILRPLGYDHVWVPENSLCILVLLLSVVKHFVLLGVLNKMSLMR